MPRDDKGTLRDISIVDFVNKSGTVLFSGTYSPSDKNHYFKSIEKNFTIIGAIEKHIYTWAPDARMWNGFRLISITKEEILGI